MCLYPHYTQTVKGITGGIKLSMISLYCNLHFLLLQYIHSFDKTLRKKRNAYNDSIN